MLICFFLDIYSVDCLESIQMQAVSFCSELGTVEELVFEVNTT